MAVTLAHRQDINPASTGAAEPKKRVRTIHIAPAPAPDAPRQGQHGSGGGTAQAGGGYFVQISAQRTEEELRTSVERLRAKYRSVIADRPLVTRRRDLGEKGGVFYLGQIGPFDTLEAATAFCTALKDAGGQCIVHRAN
jgi:cell division septation protein DedD